MNKPPIGIEPEWCWKEQRRIDLGQAIIRRIDSPYEIPTKWISEYNALLKEVKYTREETNE